MTKKLLLTFALLLTAVTGAWAGDNESCGEGVTYTYVESTHTLTISGTGAMAGYSGPSEQPWYSYATEIETLVIENGVTRIGIYAFQGCESLTTVTIPASVTTIGDYSFAGCDGLTTVTIGSGVTYIGSDVFFNCPKVEVVYCNADPEKLTWVENGCDDFKPDGTTIINVADAAPWIAKFTDMVNGTFIDTPYVPLSWNYDADTKTLTLSGTVIPSYENLDERPWIAYVEEVENIVIEDDVTRIGNHAFEGCGSLTTVTIPASVTTIGDYAFLGCTGLTTVTIPASVTTIGYYAFRNCSGLTTVTIGSGVTYIGRDAFFNCTKVEVVYCNADPEKLEWEEGGCDDFKYDGSTVIQVANAVPWNAFKGVVNGTFSDTPYVPLSWNYDADTNTLTLSGTVIPSYDDPEERPWKDYFADVENIVIEDDVTRIGNLAFVSFDGLTTVTFATGSKLETIGEAAFSNCFNLATVTIPASVTTIGDYAFQGCESLTTVTIPASVMSIGEFAFSFCTGLTTVTVYTPSCTLGDGAFNECGNLANIYVFSDKVSYYKAAKNWSAYSGIIKGITPVASGKCGATGNEDNVTWQVVGEEDHYTLYISGTGAMADYDDPEGQPWKNYRTSISSVVIGDGVTNIGGYAFSDCTNLTSVTIPASVTTIGNDAFFNSGLTSVTIPANVTSIGDTAFAGTDLTAIEIPASVTSIGDAVFSGCSNLATITVDGNNGTYDSRNDCNAIIESTPNTLVVGCKGTTIPNTVTSIGNYAFASYAGLTSIDIPASVTSIGIEAFAGSGLISVTIPASVTSIGDDAFYYCTDLATVNIGSGVTTIGNDAFVDCTKLASVTVYASTPPTLGNNAFLRCGNDLKIYVFSDLVDTYQGAWSAYSGIIKGITPVASGKCGATGNEDNVTWQVVGEEDYYTLYISGTGAMADYTNNQPWYGNSADITNVIIGDGVTSIGDWAFSDCTNLTSVTIGSSVETIGQSAFQGTDLTTVTIPASVTSIGVSAFEVCDDLATITFADGSTLTTIGEGAFAACTSLTSVTIPASVESIGENAFYGCTNLAKVNIGKGVTSIGEGAFIGCTNLATITVDGNNGTYDSRNDCNAIIETTPNTLVVGCKNTTIPNTVTSIGVGAFFNCTGLTAVTIPASVESIGGGAFDGCTGLTSIEIPASVTSIDNWAFNGCTNLATITFADGSLLESIGMNAFSGCTGLTSAITILASVTSIGEGAFTSYPCDHVYVVVPEGKKLRVAINGVTEPVEIAPTEGKADILGCLFADPTERTTSRALTLSNVIATVISIEKDVLQLKVNDEISTGASLTPAEAGSLTYTSSNEEVAIVEDGKIKALAAGTATITVSFAGNDNYAAAVSKTISVTVSLNETSVSVSNIPPTGLDLYVGDTFVLMPTTTPDGLNVTYVPDDSGVASVDDDGNVTALKEGNASVLVKVGDGVVYAESSTTVSITVSKIPTEISIEEPTLELDVNDEISTGASLAPSEAGSLTYASSNETVAKVEDGKIKALAAGTATITVSFAGDNKYAAAESKTIDVTVLAAITLTDNATNNSVVIEDNDGVKANVTLSGRTLYKDGKWNTICLPFDVTIAGSVLDGAEVHTLTTASVEGTTLKLTFGSAEATITAGVPYIIKWDKASDYVDDDAHNIVNPVFADVTIKDVNVDYWSTDKAVGFLGNYNAVSNIASKWEYDPAAPDEPYYDVLLLGGNNKLHYAGSGAGLGACRAFFLIDPTKLGDGQGGRLDSFNIDFGNGEVTRLEPPTNSPEGERPEVWYDLSGRKVANSQKPKAKGIYIHNGKKVVIK